MSLNWLALFIRQYMLIRIESILESVSQEKRELLSGHDTTAVLVGKPRHDSKYAVLQNILR